MKTFKRVTVLTLTALILILPAAAMAEDAMQRTFRDSVYGGVVGVLAGTAVLLLSKHPGDHLEYIPTGAGVGILAGAAYGMATSGVVEAAAEVENGKVAFNMPTVDRVEVYDKNANNKEIINIVQLLRFKW